jgi:RNA polymerase sigma-32 factor
VSARADQNDSIARYIAEVQRVPVLSREDEHSLAVRAQGGDGGAAAALVRANLRYVVPIALGYRRYGVRVADLISEGNVGLMTALAKFDPARGTRFVTYAAHWIRAYMLDHVMRAWSMVALGTGPLRSKVFFRLRREKARIAAQVEDPAAVGEILAQRFGTTVEKISVLAQRLEARDVSVDKESPTENGSSTLLDALASGAPSQEERFFELEREYRMADRVHAAIAELDPRERYIVETRILADGADELSLAEIGRKLGVSRERARQIEARAKAKLKKRLEGDAAVTEALGEAA